MNSQEDNEIFTDINTIEKEGVEEYTEDFILYPNSARQEKYQGKNKEEAVKESNNNTDKIIRSGKQSKINGLSFVNRYDTTAVSGYDLNGNYFDNHRLPDILLQFLNPHLNIPWGLIAEKYIEAKEFGMMRLYDVQGLPKRYCEIVLFPHGLKNIYVIFTETQASIETRVSNKIKIHKDFVETYREENRLIYTNVVDFRGIKYGCFPYGNRLDILMENRIGELEDRIKSQLDGPWKGQKQYIWDVNKMHKLDFILRRDFVLQ